MMEGKGAAKQTAAVISNRVYIPKYYNDSLGKKTDDGYGISDSDIQSIWSDTGQDRMPGNEESPCAKINQASKLYQMLPSGGEEENS